jgi:actin related protein 2/3 complex subunit 2
LLERLLDGTITSAKPFAVRLRASEIIYFCPGPDRVTVGFGLRFPEATDAAIVRIVCSQFAEVQRTIGTAPTVNFCEMGTGASIPREITGAKLPLLPEGGDGFTGYLTLSYFPSHVESPAKMENTVTLASAFRTYLNYHLKAAKSYIHSRMRNRVTSLLQVLERAKTSDPTTKKSKKTFQGKTIKKVL